MTDFIFNQVSYPILTITVFMPMVGVFLLLFMKDDRAVRWTALGTSVATLIVSMPVLCQFDTTTYKMQFAEHHQWIPSVGINYTLGVDGISVIFIFLTTLLTVLSILCSWEAISKRVKEFMIALLVLETGMLGTFVALDFFLFYLFWESMLIPMYIIIGVWGGARKLYAAMKFFLYTLAGSVLMLIAILALYFAGGQTFDVLTLQKVKFAADMQFWCFWAFFVAFAIKVPMFPFHTWLPDAHVEAPTAGSVILAGILLKMGAYGFLRFSLPMLPEATMNAIPVIMWLSVIGIIYGALVALVQPDMKKLIAYSSVSHMGFVTLGIFALTPQGLEGAILQMVNHGIVTGALFLCVGIVYDRMHTRQIADYGGVVKKMPAYAALFLLFTMASIGLPGTNGFVGEFLCLLGAFLKFKFFAVLATTGIILGAAYMLWLYQRVIFGEITNHHVEEMKDLSGREWLVLIPLVVLTLWIGVNPGPWLDVMHESVKHLVEHVNHAPAAATAVADQLNHAPAAAAAVADQVNHAPAAAAAVADVVAH